MNARHAHAHVILVLGCLILSLSSANPAQAIRAPYLPMQSTTRPQNIEHSWVGLWQSAQTTPHAAEKINALTTLTQANPTHTMGLYQLATAYEAQAEITATRQQAEVADSHPGESPSSYLGQAQAVYERLYSLLQGSDDTEALAAVAFKVARLIEKQAEKQEQLTEALNWYQIALTYAPKNGLMHYNLATLHETLNRPAQAIDHYQQAILYAPGFVASYNNLALLLASNGKLETAQSLYQQALKINPTYTLARLNLGQLYLYEGKNTLALQAFLTTLKQANLPQQLVVQAQLGAGHACYRQGFYPQAVNRYSAVVKLQPTLAEAQYYLALSAFKAHQPQLAQIAMARYLSLLP